MNTMALYYFLSLCSRLGEFAFVMPATVILSAALWRAGAGKFAAALVASVALCIALTTASKIAFMACGHVGAPQINSPSGHASLATIFYLSLARISWVNTRSPLRIFLVMTFLALIALICASRVALHAHSSAETLIGFLIGAASFMVFWRGLDGNSEARTGGSILALSLFLGVYLTAGVRLEIEPSLEKLARWVGVQLGCRQ